MENIPSNWLLDRTTIIECIVRFANAFDRKAWNVLRSCLADHIETDYSQFRGTPPAIETGDGYVESRRRALEALQTLHMSTNHEVTIDGDRATCWSAYQIYRLDTTRRPGENRLDSAGTYEHGLVRVASGWRIDRIRQTIVVVDGNRAIHSGLSAPSSNPNESVS